MAINIAKRNLQFKKEKTSKQKSKKQKKVKTVTVDSDEEDTFCLICTDSYSNSKDREKWIQCQTYKLWAHDECTNQVLTAFYKCDNGEADC